MFLWNWRYDNQNFERAWKTSSFYIAFEKYHKKKQSNIFDELLRKNFESSTNFGLYKIVYEIEYIRWSINKNSQLVLWGWHSKRSSLPFPQASSTPGIVGRNPRPSKVLTRSSKSFHQIRSIRKKVFLFCTWLLVSILYIANTLYKRIYFI